MNTEHNWVTIQMDELKKKYKSCINNNEIVLAAYIASMKRLLNGLAHVNYTELHYYEKKLFWNPLEVFTAQFIEQIDAAYHESDTFKKGALIKDIQAAVCKIYHVYRDVIECNGNADRQANHNMAVSGGTFDISIKLCAFYSDLLEFLVRTFDSSKKVSQKYAFILYPTLETTLRAEALLEKRNCKGKVVIIYLPVFAMDALDYIPICLVHEAFHTLTRKQKLMKKRAILFLRLMLATVKQQLFYGVSFDIKGSKRDKEVQEELIKKWFSPLKNYKKLIENAIDRNFYSRNLVKNVNKNISECLKGIDDKLENDLKTVCFDWNMPKTIAFDDLHKKMRENLHCIRQNLNNIILGENLRLLGDNFTFLFREIYADIACVLILNIYPNEYDAAFIKSQQFKPQADFRDKWKEFRVYIVAKSVVEILKKEEQSKALYEKWNLFAERIEKKWSNEIISGKSGHVSSENTIPRTLNARKLFLSKLMIDSYLDYGISCAGELKTLASTQEIHLNELRNKINNVMKYNEDNLIDLFYGSNLLLFSSNGYSQRQPREP